VLNLYPTYVSWHYYLFVLFVSLVTIQAGASISGLRGLQIGGHLWPRKVAYGALFVGWTAGAGIFARATPDLLSPGLAGAELLCVFGCGVGGAALLSLLGGTLLRQKQAEKVPLDDTETHRAGLMSWRILSPSSDAGVAGVVVLFADPDLGASYAAPILRAVLQTGYRCVLVTWDDHPLYHDAITVASMIICQCQALGPTLGNVILVGLGSAGDLALRCACEQESVRLVCAIGPVVSSEALLENLLLLREMTFPQALAWRRRWDRRGFVDSLRVEEALVRLRGRAAVLVSEDDGYFESAFLLVERGGDLSGLEIVEGVSHAELMLTRAPAFVAERLCRLRDNASRV